MKIGFDARMITHPGIGRYIRSLLPELVREAPGDEFILLGDPEKLSSISPAENVKIIRWDARVYSIEEQLFAFYSTLKIDLLHVPHFNVPLFLRRKIVATIHDLIYLLFPGSVPSPIAGYYARFMINSALKKADKVLTVSNHTRDDILKIFGDRYKDKIKVVHEAAGKEFRRMDNKTKEADVRCRYRLGEKIILYVGSIKPHKNTAALIDTFKLLKEWGLPHQLVLCGRWDKKEDHLKDRMVSRDIKYLGEVPTDDLIVLYGMADVLVHLSLYEGFGLTVLEAMQCGTPVVVSDTSSLPEVAGKSAYAVSPHDIENVANVVYNVVVNKQLSEGLVDTGYENVRQFSWERAARETLEVYREVIK